MVTTIPGSEILTSTLNMISQSLQIPVIIFLVVFAVFAVLAIGGLISEYTSRKKITPELIEELIYSISNATSLDEIKNVIKNANIYESQKVVLIKILRANSLTPESRHALAKKLVEFEENKFDVYLTNNTSNGVNQGISSSEREVYDNYYIELVDGEMIVREDQLTRTFNIDYSEFKSFPDDILVEDIESAYITINTKDSILSIYINGIEYKSCKYVYKSLVNAFYLEIYDPKVQETLFSFEIIDEETVKLIDLKPGKKYELDASALLTVIKDCTEISNAYARINEYGECSAYIDYVIYNSSTMKYQKQVMKQALSYEWYDQETILIYDYKGELQEMYVRLVDENEAVICIGTPDVDKIVTSEDGSLEFVLYKNGVAACDASFGLAKFCFYEYLDEDTIYLNTILGMGVIYDIVDGRLIPNTEFFDNKKMFEEGIELHFDELTFVIHKYKDSDKVFIKYITNNNGNGEEVTEAYFKGEVINEELYYSSYVLYYDQFIYNIDGQSILVIDLDS